MSLKAVVLSAFGGPECLQWSTVADPQPGEGEVLVEVAAAGLNRFDVMTRSGRLKSAARIGGIPGLECSGRVAAVGQGVTGWKLGDEVCGLVAEGAQAELVCVPAPLLLPPPRGLSLVECGGLPETVLLAWSSLWDRGRLKKGETLLVHGGTSGIGSFAIQVARAYGAHVICTVGSEEKAARAVELGAHVAINYKAQDFVDAVRIATDGRGADVIYDMVGGDYIGRNVESLAMHGRIVSIAPSINPPGMLDLPQLLHKQGEIHANGLRPRPLSEKAAIAQGTREQLWPLIEAGPIHVPIETAMPMAQVADAHRLLEAGHHVGKIMLTNDRSSTSAEN